MKKIIYFLQLCIVLFLCTNCINDNQSTLSQKTFTCKSGYGIDISGHNTVTDWDEVTADFIIIKATEGSTYTSPKFEKCRFEAQRRGIPVGAYHFMTTSSSATKQFHHFYKVVGKNIDIIPVLDVENITKGHPKNKNEMYKHVATFVKLCYQHYGVKPIIYSSSWFYTNYKLNNLGCMFWAGDVNTKVTIPHVIHQQTIKAVPGLAGKVDYDVLNCNIDTILYHK